MEEDKKKNSEETTDEKEEETKEGEEEMEDEEMFSDDEDFGEGEGDTWERVRIWVQDNLRVILSVLIVALIAVGIYNYSKKPQEQPSTVDQIVGEQGVEVQPGAENLNQNQSNDNLQVQPQPEKPGQVVVKGETTPAETQPAPVPVEKTAEGYTATAASGDGTTHLARKALKEYLGANADPTLTKEHKIYIEDYLRKHVAAGTLKVGDSRMFSDTLIKDAISQAKQLNEMQLKNLQKFSARVSTL